MATVGTVACMATISTASAFAELKGAGSTLVAPLMANWINGFEAHTNGGIPVSLLLGRLRGGYRRHHGEDRRFRRLRRADDTRTGRQMRQLRPDPLGAVGAGRLLQPAGHQEERSAYCRGRWSPKSIWARSPNGTTLKSRNSTGISICQSLPITVGIPQRRLWYTYAFTNYLSKVSSTWKSSVGYATSVQFPVGVGGKGNPGVTSVVESTKGAIGYI